MFGSANWDPRSLRLNFECNVECYDPPLAARLGTVLAEKLSRSREVTQAEMDERGLAVRLEPMKPWLPAICDHIKSGRLFAVPLIEACNDPQRTWLESFGAAVADPAFDAFFGTGIRRMPQPADRRSAPPCPLTS